MWHLAVAVAPVAGLLVWSPWLDGKANVWVREPIEYPGGWVPPGKTQCVDICAGASPFPTCFTNKTDCIHKHQVSGDYDSLLLDQLFQPQFCRDLLAGVDPTVTHRPVASYPLGIRCKEPVLSRLLVHGLWPNYDGGYPACCKSTRALRSRPFDPRGLITKYPTLTARMREQWGDATQDSALDMTCELWNHEFQKHGLCYASADDGYEEAAAKYFSTTLAVADRLHIATQHIDDMALSATPWLAVAAIQRLYDHRVEIRCTPVNGASFLASIRSCWTGADSGITQVDCVASTLDLCPENATVSLAPYVAPHD
ncbi:ribonuclease [Achlya hypogyna]|uniref:Ribonuclease n=1 Tax=Achlya hypogyna TaxID=1202772 RepID=A0A1V9YH34_ACHHY|nr:ribonuclease [Achlya hypogyna]